MSLFRQRLAVGQKFRSEDGSVEGTIVAVWPTERGSEAIMKASSNGAEVQIFVPAKPTLD